MAIVVWLFAPFATWIAEWLAWRRRLSSPVITMGSLVTNAAGRRIFGATASTLYQPSVVGNFLRGNDKHVIGTQNIPLADVRSLETLQADGRKTGILVGSLAVVVVGLAVIANELHKALCCD